MWTGTDYAAARAYLSWDSPRLDQSEREYLELDKMHICIGLDAVLMQDQQHNPCFYSPPII